MLAYLGPIGTYSHQAAEKYLRAQKTAMSCLPLPTISAVINGVNTGIYQYGLVPIENMLEGSVGATLDLLANKKTELHIVAEIDLVIKHTLIVLPGAQEADIQKIYSHTQALEQCRDFLLKKFPEAKIVPVSSTAGAVEKIKKENLQKAAAIGSRESAQRYELEILAENIADSKENLTRFVVLSKEAVLPQDKAITSFVFSCRKDKPGGLYGILRFLAEAKINMTKIESRPSKAVMGDYLFFIDIDGTPAVKKIQKALDEIKKHSDFFKLLGSYQRRK